jgi:hypothetical protein
MGKAIVNKSLGTGKGKDNLAKTGYYVEPDGRIQFINKEMGRCNWWDPDWIGHPEYNEKKPWATLLWSCALHINQTLSGSVYVYFNTYDDLQKSKYMFPSKKPKIDDRP